MSVYTAGFLHNNASDVYLEVFCYGIFLQKELNYDVLIIFI